MRRNLLQAYESELRHLRESAIEFAKKHKNQARQLGLDQFECRDPYVERLLEGFAYLTARIQQKYDAEFPRFTGHLLESIYPVSLSPTPSLAVVRFTPAANLKAGHPVRPTSQLRTTARLDDRQFDCIYRTGAQQIIWPLRLAAGNYFEPGQAPSEIRDWSHVREHAGIYLRLQTTSDQCVLADLAWTSESSSHAATLDALPLFLRGDDSTSVELYRFLTTESTEVWGRPKGQEWIRIPAAIRPLGLSEEDALLPEDSREFSGHRLLREYFALPAKFLFVELSGLSRLVSGREESELEIVAISRKSSTGLASKPISAANFLTNCAPVANVFKKSTRVHVDTRHTEYRVVFDRTKQTNFELYRIEKVEGYESGGYVTEFRSFYDQTARSGVGQQRCYAIRRERKNLTVRQEKQGTVTDYLGTEPYISVVDAGTPPHSSRLRELGVFALCTNRHLPLLLHMPDFTADDALPVSSIECVAGPSAPREAPLADEALWHLINSLSLNFSSIASDSSNVQSVRKLLELFIDPNDPGQKNVIEGLEALNLQPTVSLLRQESLGREMPPALLRGVNVELVCNESTLRSTTLLILATVMEQFLARYVSINSFTRTSLIGSSTRDTIFRWENRVGGRPGL